MNKTRYKKIYSKFLTENVTGIKIIYYILIDIIEIKGKQVYGLL